MSVLIRTEKPADYSSIDEVNRAAFGGEEEVVLVRRLRRDRATIASLVAVEATAVVAHILFSTVRVELLNAGEIVLASLAPMAVLPPYQGRGIGSALITHGIQVCRDAAFPAIILVGHRGFYPRFGFSHHVVAGLRNRFCDDESFMGLELFPRALSEISGQVIYPPAFDVLS